MPLKLPYPGYSWSITQHIGPVTEKEIIYELLQAAYVYGNDQNYADLITEHIVSEGILTANIREDAGRAQAWRDYQQVLPELGLVVSTRFTSGVEVTPVGLMLVDGIMGYSELITTQCLRYQYPNGHKQDISTTQKKQLRSNGLAIPETRTELDANNGILIKPAVLILRILIQMLKNGDLDPNLTAIECLAALVPISRNADWEMGLAELIKLRSNGEINAEDKTRRLRHIQEWFRLLGLTDIFEMKTRNVLSLSRIALSNIDLVDSLCAYHEDPSNFWIPSSTEKTAIGMSWFYHYGSLNLSGQWFLPERLRNKEYIESNYIVGTNESEPESEELLVTEWNKNITPRPFVEKKGMFVKLATPVDPDKILESRKKMQQKTRLHEEIVALVARKMKKAGYMVSEDRQSVDLLAESKDKEIIIEIKTISPLNIAQRIRLGVGQLLEYRYRRMLQTGNTADGLLVLSSDIKSPSWLVDYFQGNVRLGLAGVYDTSNIKPYTIGEAEKALERN